MGVFVRGLAVIVTLMTLVQHRAAAADDYPSRPVTLIAPWPAGGAVDTLCRIFAAKLTDRLGKSIIVENRPGAGSVLGVATAARAAPAFNYPQFLLPRAHPTLYRSSGTIRAT